MINDLTPMPNENIIILFALGFVIFVILGWLGLVNIK